MSDRTGSAFELALFQEDTWNDGAVTPVAHVIPVASGVSMGSYQGPTVDSDELTPDLEPPQGFEDTFKSDGTFPLAAVIDAFGLIMYWLFNGYSVSGSGPYEHVHTPELTTPRTVGADLGDNHASTPKYDLEYGQTIQGFSLTLQKTSGLLKIMVKVFGSGKHTDDGATPQDATPATYTGVRLQPRKGKVEIDSTHEASISEVSIDVNRAVDGDGGLNNEDYHNGLVYEGYIYTINTLKAVFDHASTMRAYEDGAEHEVKITIYATDTATKYIEITYDGCIFPRTDKRNVSSRGRQEYPFNGLKPTSISVKTVGDIADYSAIV
ncbi:hypothetical protein N9X87_00525 [bacterium]|nr:hypothetical protein [bacterium]